MYTMQDKILEQRSNDYIIIVSRKNLYLLKLS
jgi:hypothetical protein